MVWAFAQAVAADPDCCMAHIASCVAKGRLTFFVDNRRKVLSKQYTSEIFHIQAVGTS
jgi:hypothetical protein